MRHRRYDESYVVSVDHGDGTLTVEAKDGMYCTFFCNELRIDEADDVSYCDVCAGSGEGDADGTTCGTCRGSGEEPSDG